MTHSPDHHHPLGDDHEDEEAIELSFLTDAVRAAAADEEQAGYPVIEWHLGQPVPDLNEIGQERWRDVLTPLTRPVRHVASQRVRGMEPSRQAGMLVVMLDLEDGDRRADAERAAARPRRLPAPDASQAPGRPVSRQVNFRISPRQHERLAEAAQRIGAKPGQLARILTMRGVEHMLWEERSRG